MRSCEERFLQVPATLEDGGVVEMHSTTECGVLGELGVEIERVVCV